MSKKRKNVNEEATLEVEEDLDVMNETEDEEIEVEEPKNDHRIRNGIIKTSLGILAVAIGLILTVGVVKNKADNNDSETDEFGNPIVPQIGYDPETDESEETDK